MRLDVGRMALVDEAHALRKLRAIIALIDEFALVYDARWDQTFPDIGKHPLQDRSPSSLIG